MHQPKPRLQDVATAAGVSTATVSRCINHPAQVKLNLRERINAAIEDLGYSPHGAARALASSRSHTIGAIVPTIDNGIFANGIHYLQRGLSEANYTLLIASSNYSLDEELHEVKSLITRGIDGMVLIGEDHRPEVYQILNLHRIPFVNLWTYNSQSIHSCIGFDNYAAGRKIGEHLMTMGHTQIAMITGIQADNDRARDRLRGVQESLLEKGIHLRSELIRECRYNSKEASDALSDLVAAGHLFSAVVCGNDILALGALSAARQLGIAVPQALSITGFDNLEITAVLSPSLTTINVPARRMGALAATYLLNCIENDSCAISHMQLPADIKVRETTGIAPTRISLSPNKH
ncbi:MAG: LacI family DNA-binding transcriptional regulator [Oceanospirillaceae bacterium]